MPEDSALLAFGSVAAALQHTDLVLLGYKVSRAEWLGAALGLWMVVCNARVHPLGWPLAMISSLLYALVFMDNHLYGQATLQLVFVIMAAWGLWQWIRPLDG
ncbi:MAG: nicotinamide mononucleotide transporter, partial [Betaproteobacteria bacterium]